MDQSATKKTPRQLQGEKYSEGYRRTYRFLNVQEWKSLKIVKSFFLLKHDNIGGNSSYNCGIDSNYNSAVDSIPDQEMYSGLSRLF